MSVTLLARRRRGEAPAVYAPKAGVAGACLRRAQIAMISISLADGSRRRCRGRCRRRYCAGAEARPTLTGNAGWSLDQALRGALRHPLAQVLDQPASRLARRAAALVDDVDVEPGQRRLGDVEHLEGAGVDMVAHQMERHVAPAEAGEQELEPRGEIGEAPGAEADDAAREAVAHRRPVGEDELHLLFEIDAGDRPGKRRERMVRRDHRHHRDRDQELGLAIVGHAREAERRGRASPPRRGAAARRRPSPR